MTKREMCRLCHDGEIEPKDCIYYGEPNGCNSPIYGEYPKYDEAEATRVLAKVHDYLGELIRDGLVEDTVRASELADEVWDAYHYTDTEAGEEDPPAGS